MFIFKVNKGVITYIKKMLLSILFNVMQSTQEILFFGLHNFLQIFVF